MATCPMCNADVDDMENHKNEVHGDSEDSGDMGGEDSGTGDDSDSDGEDENM